MKLRQSLFAFVFLFFALPAFAQVSLTALDTAYTQNFDTLPSSGTTAWTSNSTVPGWYSVRTGTGTSIVADIGTSTGGNLYSYGAAAASDRALGTLGSGNATAGSFFHGVRLANNTGGTITSLDVAYVGEQWRNSAAAAQTVAFSYLVGSPTVSGTLTEFQSAGTAVTNLDFTSPITGGVAGPLDGNAAANRTAKSFTITGLSIPNGTEIMLRWSDPDHSGADHGLAIDDVSITPHGTAGGPTLSIDNVSHNEGDTGTTTFTFTVSLSQPSLSDVVFDVSMADGTASTGSDYLGGITWASQTITAGNTSRTFNVDVIGDTTVEPDETFFMNISNASVPVTVAQGTGTILNDDIAITRIHDVQGSVAGTTPGSDDISPLNGQSLYVEGIVTSNLLGTLKGFFLQEEDADTDADPSTSEGIFVFCNACAANAVVEGQRVRVNGTVQEFFGMTELSTTPAGVVVTDAGNHLAEVTPVHVTLPIAGNVNSFYESVEGMLVQYDTLTVTEYFQLFRYGQVVLAQGDRPRTFTEDNTPNVAGYAAHLDELARRQVILDDDRDGDEAALTLPNGQQYAYWPQTNGGFSLGTQGTDFFRGGDQVNGLVGVVQWARPSGIGSPASTWRIRPSASYPVTFTPVNVRPLTPPDVGGAIRAVGMNLLNYFTTIDTTSSGSSGPCGPDNTQDCRGADSAAELDRQTLRASKVICTLNPDVAAFMELENNDVPAYSTTISHLLDAVNISCGGAHPYTFANTGGTLGSDAIRVMQIYRTGVVSPIGSPHVDLDPVHNRPPTAQGYMVVDAANPALGQSFIVVANHLKSKGSCPAAGDPNADQNDGQGCWASLRTDQANRTMLWINTAVIPAAGSNNVLLLGDFNSYAHETPVTTLEGGGYHDMETELHGTNAYSYLFSGELGHLDYAFANNALKPQIAGADAWHINADEADLFDYNDDIKDTGEATFEEKPDGSALIPARTLWDPSWDANSVGAFRASDHDPVVVGLFPTADLAIALTDAPDPVTTGNNITYSVTVQNNGARDAAGANWSDTLPAGTTFVSLASDPAWNCTTPAVGANGTVSCDNGLFAAGATASFTLVVAVDIGVAGGSELSDTATVSSAFIDTNIADNSATTTTTVNAAPEGQLTITPTSIDFGSQTVNTTSAEQTVTLGNSGDGALAVTALDAANAPFARTATGTCSATLPITIAAGDSCTLTYTFAPSVTGAANQSLAVTANAPGSGTIALSGAGVQGHLTITPTAINFGGQIVNTTSAAQTVTLGNDGDAALNVTSLTAAAAPFARAAGGATDCGSTPITIAASSSCTLSYTFAPTTTGVAGQTLNVTANVPGSGSIALSGLGAPPQADISISNDDGVDFARVGDIVAYTITVSNPSGPSSVSVDVKDTLPPNLDNGSWTCAQSGGASCGSASGSGNTLTDTATLPVGGSVIFIYTATVLAEGDGSAVNSANANIANGANDPNLGNNTANDFDTIVIFRDGFEAP